MRIVDAATVEVTISFIEADKNTDGTPLTDLAYTSVYYKSDIPGAVEIQGAKITASSPAGNKPQSTTLIIAAPVGRTTKVAFTVNETDLDGNAGLRTDPFVFTVERVAPDKPKSFTVA